MAFTDPHALLAATSVVDRFLRYARVYTTSDAAVSSEQMPSTERQLDLSRMLVEELQALGLDGPSLDDNGYVVAHLPGQGETTVALVAHVDTAPDYSGDGVKPVLHHDYDGGVIELGHGIKVDPALSPKLAECVGETVITADGSTLLGADDKAGVAIVMGVLEYLIANPDVSRPPIAVCFTPDEEIGRGAARFPYELVGADHGFTIDGSWEGEINAENFEGVSAKMIIRGIAVHPGFAKDRLVNALDAGARLMTRVPKEKPETTEGKEGFFHCVQFSGNAAEATLHYILRDFDLESMEVRKETMRRLVAELEAEEPRLSIDLEIDDSYPNMARFLKGRPEILERLTEAVRLAGLEPQVEPIRGGTDGSTLTARGLPCPNIFTGGMSFHGPTEWICTRSMGLSMATILNLLELTAGE